MMTQNWLRRITKTSRTLFFRCKYYSNLWMYNTQKAVDVILYGKRKQMASIPFMITSNMRKSLMALGYEEKDVRMMQPARACTVIKDNITKNQNPHFHSKITVKTEKTSDGCR